MAPLPTTGTARLILDYTSMGVQHSLLLRPARNLSVSEQGVMANAWASAMAQRMLTTDSFFGVSYADTGNAFTTPILYTPIPGVIVPGATVWDEDPESAFISFIARSTTTGRRCRYTLFSPCRTANWPADNRYNPGDSAPIDALRVNISQLIVFGTPGPVPTVAIDNTFLNPYGYVNVGKNSYWQREQR